MIGHRKYIQAWLTLLLFDQDSDVFLHAWDRVKELESKNQYPPRELDSLRRQANAWFASAQLAN